MSLQFIIDGYNLIKHPQLAQRLKTSGDAREKLLSFIKAKNLTGSLKNKVTVVFDGYPDANFPMLQSDISVIFSRKISADEKIRKLLEESGNPKNIIVVSDDREIQFFTKSCGAQALGIEEFIGASEEKEARKLKRQEEESEESKLNYTQMSEINKELRKIWLK